MPFYDGFWAIPLTIDNSGKSIRKKAAAVKNQIVFQNVLARYILDALKRYHFEGLPETVSERVLLQSLLWYGRVCIFERGGALFGLPCAPSGAGLTIYGDYGSAFVFAANGQLNGQCRLYVHGSDESAFLARTNGAMPDTQLRGVMIRENAIMFPFVRIAMQYAEAVADAYRTLDVVRRNLKAPYVLVGQEEVIPSIKKFLEDVENNVDKLALDSGVFPPDKVAALQLYQENGALTDTTQLIEWYENKYRELCGIDSNGQMDKKGENLVTAEISVNDMYEEISVDKSIQYIQEGLDDVNKLFGTSIKVEGVKNEQDMAGDAGQRSGDVPGDDTGDTPNKP